MILNDFLVHIYIYIYMKILFDIFLIEKHFKKIYIMHHNIKHLI
jgi:hypothetical protein